MSLKTPLYDAHLRASAKMVDFSGWDMPIHYGSQVKEHEAVRSNVGIFDVSHMTVVDIKGEDAKIYLQKLLANDVDKLKTVGKALYTAMLNENAGVIDDLIVYLTETGYRLVVNCATREKDLDWMRKQIGQMNVTLHERSELAMIAVQGPAARNVLKEVLPDLVEDIEGTKPFNSFKKQDWFFGRTGYTGEDGFEIILPGVEAESFWEKLVATGAAPCGLGARDTLRLEAGLNLYGQDMTDKVSPLEANMAWTVAWEPQERDFIGRAKLAEQKQKGHDQLVGLILEGRGVMRSHQTIIFKNSEVQGEVTSGTFSPTLKTSIALARVPADCNMECSIDMRGKLVPARVVKLPFVRNGKACYE